MKHRAVVLSVLVVSSAALADSPLTSIDLTAGYGDVPGVKAAKEGRTDQALDALVSSGLPTDQRVAIAAALSDLGQRQYADAFLTALDAKRPGDFAPADLLVLGYLVAADDYLELKAMEKGAKGPRGQTPLQLLDKAAGQLPKDFAAQYVRALVKAQAAMAKSSCQVWKGPNTVLQKFAPEQRNLREPAVAAAVEYLALYEEDCPGSERAKAKGKEELNQIYSLALLGSQVVAGTQGGVVIWSATATDQPPVVRKGFICNTLTHGDAAWAGCQAEVVRWNGTAFKSYLSRPVKADGAYYQPMRGLDGKLWVRLGQKLWEYDEKKDAFAPVKNVPWAGSDPYSIVVRKNGEVWWVEFLQGIHAGPRVIPKKTAEYPGSDPRAFRELDGVLWAEDFESGALRYDDSSGRFVKVPGVVEKCTGVARDGKGRLVLLQYTDGLRFDDGLKVDLRSLEYMRDLAVDGSGVIWVAGWQGLAKLTPVGGGFEKKILVVK